MNVVGEGGGGSSGPTLIGPPVQNNGLAAALLKAASPAAPKYDPTHYTPPPPDYLGLIKGTPAYQAWLLSANQRRGNAASDRARAIRALALQFGGLPPGFKDAFGDLTPEDLAAEGANQFSVTADLQRQDQMARENISKGLAARGMLQSGELGYGNQQEDLAFGKAQSDAASQFLSALGDAVSGYATGVGNINAEEPGVVAGVMPLVQQLYPYNPTPVAATPPNLTGALNQAPALKGAAPAKGSPLRNAIAAANLARRP